MTLSEHENFLEAQGISALRPAQEKAIHAGVLAGENVLRAMRDAERVAGRLQRERPPSTKTIHQLDGRPAS